MSEGEQSERRKDDRLPEECRIAYRRIHGGEADSRQQATDTINLSASGLCLRATEALEPDSHLAMELQLDPYPEPLVALGRVVWCEKDGDQYKVGVCFTWLREADRADLQRIADYLESRRGT